ncbi:PepSY-associated TM helix domain-containing protein [Porifericola rhodea]|uniref:PepSY-associated TM helix domain-containing protein n=1 Tax=Porifericola rhodea TaxID=930972 RepID=UPI00266596AD|nr:PepSY-associated TM helix domain-containing protein [Porifericola rhodea]WKN33297.1 PepSY-associated TM helix domain-containing protein [Porifericola rhodea]
MAKSSYSIRKLFNDIHLWLGVGSGLILFLVCLSGTIYTFRAEVESMLEPEKEKVAFVEGQERMSTEAIVEKLQQNPGGLVSSVTIPHAKDAAYKVSIKENPKERRGTTYYVNPYTAEVQGSTDGPATGFFMSMFRLHRWLLMEQSTGRIIVGVATIIFVFLVISGLILWLPKKLKYIRQGLLIKTSANWKRVNHDLHNTLGFYASILLFVMAITGLCWSFGWYRDGLSQVLGTRVFGQRGGDKVTSTVVENASALSIAELIQKSESVLNYEGDYTISIPNSADAAVSIRKSKPKGFFSLYAYDKIELDQYSGEVLKAELYAEKPLNEKIAASIKPIHTGEIFGTFSKILYFLACLIGTSLPVTGIIIWLNKLKKKAKKKQKQKSMNKVGA